MEGTTTLMRLALWGALFLISNMLGIEVFRAAVTLPFDEALVPRLLTVPLIALAALGASRVCIILRRADP
jgi:hypothetical protein